MNTKELRIGNYIESGKEYDADSSPFEFKKVRSIGNEDQTFEQIEYEDEESMDWIFKDNWCGIPITEEWLEKFGFKKESNFFLKRFCIGFDGENYFYEPALYEDYPCLKIIYVHQLQNLYFALTGDELEL